jgi:glutathione S-transferase
MPFKYVTVDEAIARSGLRMVVVGGVPSPWGEAAKGILHIKRIEWTAVRLSYDSEPLKQWSGQRSGPVAIYHDERPRSGWAEILLLAERLAPEPALLPADAAERALMFGLAHEICGEGGLGWSRRLQMVHAGLQNQGGFAPRVAPYLAKKYGYSPEAGAAASQRVAQLLRMLATRLQAQRASGSGYYIGERVSALDVYSATFMTDAALDPVLLAHRDRMYAEHLELPLS